MTNNTPQCVHQIEASAEVRKRIDKIQLWMAEAAEECFSKAELDYQRTLVRLAVEFRQYLQLACKHQFCQTYISESIFAGVDSYCGLARAYKVLQDATESTIDWSDTSPSSLKQRFSSVFDDFDSETNFGPKCRLLLDLFKFQVVFAGMSYD